MRISDWSSDVCSSDLGARLHHLLDDLVIDLVAVVDDVDSELHALEEHLPRGHVGPDLGAALVSGLHDRGDLEARHVPRGAVVDAVSRAGEDLDGLDATADPLSDELARSEGRRVGNGWVSTCSSWWVPDH